MLINSFRYKPEEGTGGGELQQFSKYCLIGKPKRLLYSQGLLQTSTIPVYKVCAEYEINHKTHGQLRRPLYTQASCAISIGRYKSRCTSE